MRSKLSRFRYPAWISNHLQRSRGRQHGASLIVSLLMLVVVLLLGISSTQIALQGEKASRNDRDRQIAFNTAEMALIDAELDIENSPDVAKTRSAIFSPNRADGFVDDCGVGGNSVFLGLCASAGEGATPAWLAVDFLDAGVSTAKSVPYGKFTGQVIQTGKGSLTARLPRYVIELMAYNRPGETAEVSGRSYFYRITALGFGARESTQVVLQTFYRKEN